MAPDLAWPRLALSRAVAAALLFLFAVRGGPRAGAAAAAAGTEPATAVRSEDLAKAERLASLIHFVEWPARKFSHPESPFIVGIQGATGVAASLESLLQGRSYKGHPIEVRRLARGDNPALCHLLYIPRTPREAPEPVLRQLRKAGVLSVGESEAFLGRGGVMRLRWETDSLRLSISLEASQREHLVVSSKLLQLAEATPPARPEMVNSPMTPPAAREEAP